MGETTWIDTDDKGNGVHVCNNCGSHAVEEKDIKHHASCKPGEGAKWVKFYGETAPEEEEDLKRINYGCNANRRARSSLLKVQ